MLSTTELRLYCSPWCLPTSSVANWTILLSLRKRYLPFRSIPNSQVTHLVQLNAQGKSGPNLNSNQRSSLNPCSVSPSSLQQQSFLITTYLRAEHCSFQWRLPPFVDAPPKVPFSAGLCPFRPEPRNQKIDRERATFCRSHLNRPKFQRPGIH